MVQYRDSNVLQTATLFHRIQDLHCTVVTSNQWTSQVGFQNQPSRFVKEYWFQDDRMTTTRCQQ